ncbi:glycosyltransferase family 2 protein [Fibrobacterota bacterium]
MMNAAISPRIDIIRTGSNSGENDWPLGSVYFSKPCPEELYKILTKVLLSSRAEYILFWDEHLGMPEPEMVRAVCRLPGNVWHAGLRLGLSGLPRVLDFVHPAWTLNLDPSPEIESSGWRISLRACLAERRVLQDLEHVSPEFDTLEGAGLDMGYRYITQGVFVRHVPWLIPGETGSSLPSPSLKDEVLFCHRNFNGFWNRWVLFRVIMTAAVPRLQFWKHWYDMRKSSRERMRPKPFAQIGRLPGESGSGAEISILIPTLDRYPYLKTLLKQVREHDIKPYQIIIIDQTAPERRKKDFYDEFNDLPLKVIFQDSPGQCSSRNAGIKAAKGEYILFLDDDDEISQTLLKRHLESLDAWQAQVSSGIAHEDGIDHQPHNFTFVRTSDVFPTNNTMIKKTILNQSGLFDLAYNHGSRADSDLGTRLYLEGNFMVLNPGISVIHHHAPQGGLRVHKARTVTYASSRNRLFHRHLPSETEIYRARRFFTPSQVREMLWIFALATFKIRGGLSRKCLKMILSLLAFPHTCWIMFKRNRAAGKRLKDFPVIPRL